MIIEAKTRLLADEKLRLKRQDIDKKIDQLDNKVKSIKKGLPSKLNHMKVSQENQIQKRKQILDLKDKIQDKRKEKLRYKEK